MSRKCRRDHDGRRFRSFRLLEADGIGTISTLQSGEIVGEMSFVDSAPPQVNVVADVSSEVLDIDRAALAAKIDDDPSFGLRFYRALSMLLADRLRGTVSRLGYDSTRDLAPGAVMEDELEEAVVDNVSQAGDRFSRLLRLTAR